MLAAKPDDLNSIPGAYRVKEPVYAYANMHTYIVHVHTQRHIIYVHMHIQNKMQKNLKLSQ